MQMQSHAESGHKPKGKIVLSTSLPKIIGMLAFQCCKDSKFSLWAGNAYCAAQLGTKIILPRALTEAVRSREASWQELRMYLRNRVAGGPLAADFAVVDGPVALGV